MPPTLASVGHYLEQHANNGTVIYYTELYRHFGVPENHFRSSKNPISPMLGRLVNADVIAGRALRSSVVVRKRGDMDRHMLIPADKYFEILCKIHNLPMPQTRAEKRQLHSNELARLRNPQPETA